MDKSVLVMETALKRKSTILCNTVYLDTLRCACFGAEGCSSAGRVPVYIHEDLA